VTKFAISAPQLGVAAKREAVPFHRRGGEARTQPFGESMRLRAITPAQQNDEFLAAQPAEHGIAVFGPEPVVNGLPVEQWRDDTNPTFPGNPIALEQYETSRSLALRPGRRGFVLGTGGGSWLTPAGARPGALQLVSSSFAGPVRPNLYFRASAIRPEMFSFPRPEMLIRPLFASIEIRPPPGGT